MRQLLGIGNLEALPGAVVADLEELGLSLDRLEATSDLPARVERSGSDVVGVLVGTGLTDPLEVVRSIGRLDASLEVMLLSVANRESETVVARAIAPLLGPQVRALPTAEHAQLLAEVQAGVERTLARRVDSSLPEAGRHRGLEQQIHFRRSAEEHFRQSQVFLDSIVENVPDMIFVKEAEQLRFVRFNRAGEELLGIPRNELYGKNDHDFFPPEEADFFTRKDREVLAGHKIVEILEEPIDTRHRGRRWLRTRKVPVRDARGRPRYLVGISQDITEQKRAREELAQAVGELARSNRELEDFAYIASHDLQEPLRKIRAFGGMLAERAAPKLDEEECHFLERMQSATDRMQRLIEDLLLYSRAGRGTDEPSGVALDDLIAEVLEDLRTRVSSSDATVEVEPLPSALGHATQLHQLFQNLIGNALKFHRTGVPPTVRIRSAEAADGFVAVVVEDEGVGFEPRHAERIFAPFQRLHTREEFAGTGIGLAICQRIAERAGGSITATASPGAGARFTVTLPAPPSEGA